MSGFLLETELPRPTTQGDRARPRVAPRSLVELPDGRTIAYAQSGSGPALVAIHGTLMTLEDLQLGPVPALSRHFQVTAVDRPGHGESKRHRLVDASIQRQAELIRCAVQALGLRRPVLLGHSLGGAVALAYAMQHPDEVAGVVALAPPCFPEPRLEQALFGPRAMPLLGEALSRTMSATLDPTVLKALWWICFAPQPMSPAFAANFPFETVRRPSQMVAQGEDANVMWSGLARNALAYRECRVPVRILAGGSDLVVNSWAHGEPAASLMPNARFERLHGLGHMIHHVAIETVVDAARDVARASREG